ncbi:MAG TPA: acyl-CoA dehydrogenase family protein [Candidatus Xenobia bacterium]|jgi:isovaleryl-CoA dehydrogenase
MTDLAASLQSFAAIAEEAARNLVAPHAATIDREDRWRADIFRALAGVMSMAPSVPKEYGGGGYSLVDCNEAGAAISAASPSIALSYSAHAFLCAHNLWLLGTEAQRRRYLPGLARFNLVGAFAITEPGAGSDATATTTRAERDGDYWWLSGVKTFITNGSVADVVLLFARTDAGVSLFIVEKQFSGFGVGKNLVKMGFRGSPTSELILEECRVPAENLIGEDGAGGRLMMRCLDVERTLLSGVSIGILRSLYDVLRASAGPSQAWQELLAETSAALAITRTMGNEAARALQEGERVTVPASVTKLYGADITCRLAHAAVDLIGLEALRADSTAQRLLRDAKLLSIGAGTSEIQKLILAREALK